MLNALVSRIFPKSNAHERDAGRLYAQIVAQARQPVFYAQLGVPDTPTGRFELIVAHAALVFRHMRVDGKPSDNAQAVFDFFFADMDRSLRELGVGDLSVPKKIKKMGEMFYGRAVAYDDALDRGEPDALAKAVAGNILAGMPEGEAARHAQTIAGYMIASDKALSGHERHDIETGVIAWPDVTLSGQVSNDRED